MKTAEQVLREWMNAVNNADAEALMAMYDDTAVLLPTFSNRLLNTREAISDYFARLTSREDLSIALHEKTLHIEKVAGDVYALYGIYCWRFSIEGELLSFEARFSYVLDLVREKPIVHHHSSQIPRMI